jgi:hypothetical protein
MVVAMPPAGAAGGRSQMLAEPKRPTLGHVLGDGGLAVVATICRGLGVSRATLYRALKDREGIRPAPR